MARDARLDDWSGGTNNRARPSDLPGGTARELRNVDPHPEQGLTLRTGYAKVVSGTDIRGALPIDNRILYVDDGFLYVLDVATGFSDTLAAVSGSAALVGDVHNSKLYFFAGSTGYTYSSVDGLQSWRPVRGTLSETILNSIRTQADIGYDALLAYADRPYATGLTGHALQSHGASIFVADGSTLWFTVPFYPEIVDQSKNFFQYPERIKILLATKDGIYVVADKTYFLSAGVEGSRPTQDTIGGTSAVEGTGIKLPSSEGDETERVAWMTEYGLAIGSGGGVTLPSQANFVPEVGPSGTSGVLEYNGNQLVVTSTRGTGTVSSLAATDFFEAEVIPPPA